MRKKLLLLGALVVLALSTVTLAMAANPSNAGPANHTASGRTCSYSGYSTKSLHYVYSDTTVNTPACSNIYAELYVEYGWDNYAGSGCSPSPQISWGSYYAGWQTLAAMKVAYSQISGSSRCFNGEYGEHRISIAGTDTSPYLYTDAY